MSSPSDVIVEMWSEYAVGILFLLVRIFTRCRVVVGWRWQGDDFLALAAVVLFTVSSVTCFGGETCSHGSA